MRSFRSFFFGSGFGYYCYYILRNDWVWSLLSDHEKEFVRQQNDYWNNNNPGYKDPEKYQGQQGRSFSTNDDRCVTWEGRMISEFLQKEKPQRVLEVGPGSGYYTRQVIDCPSVANYYATDINVGFLACVERAIEDHPRASQVTTELVAIERLDEAPFKVDAIIILSALHHIPDRADFMRRIAAKLAPGGAVFLYEPTHSLARVVQPELSDLQ
jgi:2-polyprenyl-3-methyl-5-hydroxy-6-metoxy-1,4-benzoquinol methylase